MERSYLWALALLVGFLPALARADGAVTTVFFNTGNEARIGRDCPGPVTIERAMGGARERVTMAMLDCNGVPREEAVRAVSVLARPRTLARPSDDDLEAFDPGSNPGFVAAGVRRVHPELVDRMQRIGDAFEGHAIEIYSGYRPQSSETSRHHHARALDLTVEGVERERVRDLAVGFERTGVGWYPNSVFVHVDVREQSHYWVDVSRPGQAPSYVRGASPPVASDAEASSEEAAPSIEEIEAMMEPLLGLSSPRNTSERR